MSSTFKQGQTVKAELEKEVKKKEDDLKAEEKKIMKMREDYEKQSAVMADKAKQAQEEKIQKFMELCEYNNDLKKKYYGKMQSMLKELEDVRRGVLSKRNFDKNYKVFVKYPAGYEG